VKSIKDKKKPLSKEEFLGKLPKELTFFVNKEKLQLAIKK
jgi:hypothetical protein